MRRVRADARAGLPPAAGREGAGPGPPPAAGREGADPGAGPGLGTAAGGEGTETGLPPAAGGEEAIAGMGAETPRYETSEQRQEARLAAIQNDFAGRIAHGVMPTGPR